MIQLAIKVVARSVHLIFCLFCFVLFHGVFYFIKGNKEYSYWCLNVSVLPSLMYKFTNILAFHCFCFVICFYYKMKFWQHSLEQNYPLNWIFNKMIARKKIITKMIETGLYKYNICVFRSIQQMSKGYGTFGNISHFDVICLVNYSIIAHIIYL